MQNVNPEEFLADIKKLVNDLTDLARLGRDLALIIEGSSQVPQNVSKAREYLKNFEAILKRT